MGIENGEFGRSNLKPKATDTPQSTREALVDEESRTALGLAAALAARRQVRQRTTEVTRKVIEQHRATLMAKDPDNMTPHENSSLYKSIERRVVPLLRAAEPDSAIKTLITGLDHLVSKRTEELKDQLQNSEYKITQLHRIVGEITAEKAELSRTIAVAETALSENRTLLAQSEETRFQVSTERDTAREKIIVLETNLTSAKAEATAQLSNLRTQFDQDNLSSKKDFESRVAQVKDELVTANTTIKSLEATVTDRDQSISRINDALKSSKKWQVIFAIIAAVATAAALILIL